MSRTTASHALSGTGRVAQTTRERVRQLAEEMGFTPSPRALALKTGRSGVLAIVNSVSDELAGGTGEYGYFMSAAHAAALEAMTAGYTLALVPPTSQVSWLEQLDIEGAVVMDPVENDPLTQTLRKRRVPFVTLGRQVDDDAVDEPFVDMDFGLVTRLALDHLWERGSRQPMVVVTTEQRSYVTAAVAAHEQWATERGLVPHLVRHPEARAESGGYEATVAMLRQRSGVDALFTPVDSYASGALTAVTERGWDVPHQFRIITLEGVRARASRPQMTAIDDHPSDTARAAIRILVATLRSEPFTDLAPLPPPNLIVRATT